MTDEYVRGMQLMRWSMSIPGACDARCKVDLVAQKALVLARVLVGDEIRDAIAAGGRNAARLFKYIYNEV